MFSIIHFWYSFSTADFIFLLFSSYFFAVYSHSSCTCSLRSHSTVSSFTWRSYLWSIRVIENDLSYVHDPLGIFLSYRICLGIDLSVSIFQASDGQLREFQIEKNYLSFLPRTQVVLPICRLSSGSRTPVGTCVAPANRAYCRK